MEKECIICQKKFKCSPSDKKVTCSAECRKAYASIRNRKRGPHSEETKRKISESAKGRDLSEIRKLAIAAAAKSPKSGRFVTNVNAIDWHLISPEGVEYKFHSLHHWLRENGKRLFGCDPDTREFNNVRSGLEGAKRAAQGKNYGSLTYKGWRSIPVEQNESNKTEEVLLTQKNNKER